MLACPDVRVQTMLVSFELISPATCSYHGASLAFSHRCRYIVDFHLSAVRIQHITMMTNFV